MAKANFIPKTPDIEALAIVRDSKAALASGAAVLSARDSAIVQTLESFRALGVAAANGAVALTQVAHAFASCVASGLFEPDNAKAAYLAYATAFNARNAEMPVELRGRVIATDGDSFEASVSQFKTFGELGAVAQGATIVARGTDGKVSRLDWTPHFYIRIATAFAAVGDTDRVDSLYGAYVACNRIARDKGKAFMALGSVWDMPALSDEEITSACTKAKSSKTDYERMIAALGQAGKIAKKAFPQMQPVIEEALIEAKRAYQEIDRAKANEVATVQTLVKANVIGYEKEAKAKASAIALVAAE